MLDFWSSRAHNIDIMKEKVNMFENQEINKAHGSPLIVEQQIHGTVDLSFLTGIQKEPIMETSLNGIRCLSSRYIRIIKALTRTRQILQPANSGRLERP